MSKFQRNRRIRRRRGSREGDAGGQYRWRMVVEWEVSQRLGRSRRRSERKRKFKNGLGEIARLAI